MPTIPRSQNHLAQLLNIAKSTCSRHADRGMPTDNLEAARAWMQSTLDPARRKGIRFDKHYQSPQARQRQPAKAPAPSLAERATALLAAASALLATDQAIDALVPSLRAALHAVPKTERDNVGLTVDVMELLVAHVLVLWPADRNALCEDGTPVWCNGTMSDSDAQTMGEFWFEVAAGEWLVA